jgi:hypothetical protein
VKLQEWDDKVGPSGSFVEVEYPDKVIKEFVDYFRCTKRWRERDEMELIYHRWLKFERELTDCRNEANRPAVQADKCAGTTKSGDPCRITHSIEGGLCAIHRRALVPA